VLTRVFRLDKQIRDWPLETVPSLDDACGQTPLEMDHKFMILLMRSFATTGLREIGKSSIKRYGVDRADIYQL
jgi:hypothetical protein